MAVSALVRTHLGCLKIVHKGETSLLIMVGETKFSPTVDDDCTVGIE